MYKFITAAKGFLTGESGATMVEYVLIIALLSVAAIATAGTLATAISGEFTSAAGQI